MSDEWIDELAPRARKIAADVIARSGGEAFRPEINRGQWDADDTVIAAMQATIQTAKAEELLRECLVVLNGNPRAGLNSRKWPDTYKLAAGVDAYFKEVQNG